MALRRSFVLAMVAALLATMLAVLAPAAEAANAPERTYRVTVENLTENQLITPGVVATHQHRTKIFRVGRAASEGIQQLAENGGVPVLAAELESTRGVGDVQVAGSAPIAPGHSAEVLIAAPPGTQQLSVAAMLICTNDGFAAATNVWLPGAYGYGRTAYGASYDAGTEINTELYVDLVPPCDGEGETGATNPALAEGGVVHRHEGIQEVGDLTIADNGWRDPAIKVTVERVRVFEISVENLTDGQRMTPFVASTHLGSGIFRPGRTASPGLQSLAENGGVPDLVAELEAHRRFGTVAVIGSGVPVEPGTAVSSEIVVADRFRRLSVAGMLICTNDGFGGVNSVRLPARIGESVSVGGAAYDAGTEINTEDYDDLVPPCDGEGQTGASNPALAEDGRVRSHPGIRGGADLSPDIHGWDDPVIQVTITRVG